MVQRNTFKKAKLIYEQKIGASINTVAASLKLAVKRDLPKSRHIYTIQSHMQENSYFNCLMTYAQMASSVAKTWLWTAGLNVACTEYNLWLDRFI